MKTNLSFLKLTALHDREEKMAALQQYQCDARRSILIGIQSNNDNN